MRTAYVKEVDEARTPQTAKQTAKNSAIIPAQSYVFPDQAALTANIVTDSDIKDLSPAEHLYFVNGLRQIKADNPDAYAEFCESVAAIKMSAVRIKDAQFNLIMGHYETGKSLVELQNWFAQNFPRDKGWIRFLVEQLQIDCTIRTCQRAMRFWNYWHPYEDTLIQLARTEPALEGLMMFSRVDTSAVAEAISIEYFRVQLTQQISDGSQQSQTIFNAGRLTTELAERIHKTGNVIDQLPENVKSIVLDIVQRHNVFNPDMVKEMGSLPVAALEDIAASGSINTRQMIGQDRDEMAPPVPVAQASVTDIKILKGDVTEQRRYEVSQKIQEKQSARDAENGIQVAGRLKPILLRVGDEGWLEELAKHIRMGEIEDGTLIRFNIDYLQEQEAPEPEGEFEADPV